MLVQQYQVFADVLGGPFKEKAEELRAELQQLGQPDRRVESEVGKKLADSFGNMVTSITEKAAEGKESVSKMAADILHDIDNMAIKLAEQKFILPFFQNAFGASGGTGGTGGGSGSGGGGGFSWGGLFGMGKGNNAGPGAPSIWQPPAKAGGAINFGSVATDIAKAGVSALTPKVTSNVIKPIQPAGFLAGAGGQL